MTGFNSLEHPLKNVGIAVLRIENQSQAWESALRIKSISTKKSLEEIEDCN